MPLGTTARQRPSLKGSWKITARERDRIYQSFLAQSPNGGYTSDHARAWIKSESQQGDLSPGRIRDFVSQAVRAERGELEREWAWWVGCSKR